MRISRREFVKSVAASGIALSVSRLAIAAEPSFAERETLPGRRNWNPAANGDGSHRRRPKGNRRQALRIGLSRCRSPGLAAEYVARHALLAPDATHVYTGLDLSRLSGALKPTVVVTAADLARIGTRVPEFYAGDLFCPVGTTPLYLGQPVALLIFEEFDAFDQARLAMRDGTFVKFGEETGPIRAPDYGAYRFTRVAGPTPDAPDVYSTFKDGLASPEHFQNTELPVWAPLAMTKAPLYAKAAAHGEQIRAELAANNPALLVLDREFETHQTTRCFSSRNAASPGTTRAARTSSSCLGCSLRSKTRRPSCTCSAKPRADFKPARINAHFAYIGGGFGGRDHTPFPLYVALAGMFFPDRPVRLAYRPLSAVPGGHQTARIQNTHADRGRSRERQARRIRRRPHIGWRRPRQFLGHRCVWLAPDGDRRLRHSESRRYHGRPPLTRRDRGVDARLRSAGDKHGAGDNGRRNICGVAARPDRFSATQRAQGRRPDPGGKSV